MTDLLVIVERGPTRRGMRYVARVRDAGRVPFVFALASEAAAGMAGLGCEVADAGTWLASGRHGDVNDWEGVRALCHDLGSALGLSGAWTAEGVDLWDACRVDLALHVVAKWVKATNLAISVVDEFRPRGVVVGSGRTLVGRAFTAVATARGVPVAILEGPRPAGGLHALVFRARIAMVALRATSGGPKASPGPGGPGAVALLNHARRNTETLEPIAAALAARGHRILYAPIGPDAEAGAERMAAPRQRVDRVSLGGRALSVVRASITLGGDVRRRWLAGSERLAYRGLPMSDVAGSEAPWVIAAALLGARVWAERGAAFCDATRPSLIITTNERAAFNRALCGAARRRGIRVLLVQFGIAYPHPAVWDAPLAADAVAAEGEASATVLQAAGGAAAIRVTGQPRHDELLEVARHFDAASVRAKLGLPSGARLVLYASHAFGEEATGLVSAAESDRRGLEQELRAVYEAVAELPGVVLVAKPHPNESMAMHREVRGSLPGRSMVLVDSSEPIRPLLLACDVLVTHHSTTGVDAVVLGKPLVIVNLTGKPDAFPYVAEGVALGAYRADEIGNAVARALQLGDGVRREEAARTAFLRRHAAGADGLATSRTMQLVAELLGFSAI